MRRPPGFEIVLNLRLKVAHEVAHGADWERVAQWQAGGTDQKIVLLDGADGFVAQRVHIDLANGFKRSRRASDVPRASGAVKRRLQIRPAQDQCQILESDIKDIHLDSRVRPVKRWLLKIPRVALICDVKDVMTTHGGRNASKICMPEPRS